MNIIKSGIRELFQPPDSNGFGELVHTRKSTKRADMVMTKQEAVATSVADGDYFGTGLCAVIYPAASPVVGVIHQDDKYLRMTGQGKHEITYCSLPTWWTRSTSPMSPGRYAASPTVYAARRGHRQAALGNEPHLRDQEDR
jgi:hypothetical protein